MSPKSQIIYCRCAFANVVPKDVKDNVLRALVESGVSFDMVSDLCEMSARKDERLKHLVDSQEECSSKIVACYPRAVKGLFHNAGKDLPKEVEVVNMREDLAETIIDKLLAGVEEEVA
ncbi:MAG: hypothetical protein AAGA18_03670 [Verrucomicrobiota bacterium]